MGDVVKSTRSQMYGVSLGETKDSAIFLLEEKFDKKFV